jgi:hypothetical protein
LAGEAAANDVNSVVALRRERPDVVVLWHFWPVFFEDFGCIRVYLHLPLALHASSLKAERKATNPGE